jgi:hypothetical protein
MSEDKYKYEWLRTSTVILYELLVDLGHVCSCSKMTQVRIGNFCIWYTVEKMENNDVQLTTADII